MPSKPRKQEGATEITDYQVRVINPETSEQHVCSLPVGPVDQHDYKQIGVLLNEREGIQIAQNNVKMYLLRK